MIDSLGIGRPDDDWRPLLNEEAGQDAVTSGQAPTINRFEQASTSTAPAQAATAELRINRRERFKTERDQRHGKSVVRIVRLKPSADGGERPAASLEFADRHLPGMIAMLQALLKCEAA